LLLEVEHREHKLSISRIKVNGVKLLLDTMPLFYLAT
jgi:hypothetical protein